MSSIESNGDVAVRRKVDPSFELSRYHNADQPRGACLVGRIYLKISIPCGWNKGRRMDRSWRSNQPRRRCGIARLHIGINPVAKHLSVCFEGECGLFQGMTMDATSR